MDKGIWRVLACLLFVWGGGLITSCEDEAEDMPKEEVRTYKVAVLMQESERERWTRTAEWALQYMAEAQRGMSERVELQLEFKCQDDADIDDYMKQLAEDATVEAIVGPTTSGRAEQMALKLTRSAKYHKPLISPSATQVEYQRKFAATDFVWNMAECDISELEVIISGIASTALDGNLPVALLAHDDGTGNRDAYSGWFGFITEEYGLMARRVYLYKTEDDVRRYARELCGTEWTKGNVVLVFNPSDEGIALAFDDEVGKIKAEIPRGRYFYGPRVYCSDAFVSERIASAVSNLTYEGVDLYASPESGFAQAYHQRFGEDIVNGEAQFYDALCLVAYAATLSASTELTLNDALACVVEGREGKGSSWLPTDMAQNFRLLAQGVCPDIDGVSSSWTFDGGSHSCSSGSTFRRWRLYDGRFLTTEYVTTDGSKRSTASKDMWNWTASQMQTFHPDEGTHLEYSALDENWALLVAASKGWSNYRFQSDVFAMYQLLKLHGYDDEHIVLIVPDDVACHSNNPYPGVLRISPTGENVYEPTAIDYRLDDLLPADIGLILQGKADERLPYVLHADEADNVMVFWSGHGSPGSMDFGGQSSMSYALMREHLEGASYRKLLFVIESCYSGGLGDYCTALPKTLFITAAAPYETSHAAVWDEEMGVYLSNGFTRGFQEAIYDNPDIPLRDLYYTLARHTTGSHVKLYNIVFYGNAYSDTMGEFFLDIK